MKYTIFLLFSSFIGFCVFTNCVGQNCPEGINLLPMYGNVEKCKEQIESDEQFLKEVELQQPDRWHASLDYLGFAESYIVKGDYDTAMKRINQAWLLDSTNIIVYPYFIMVLDITDRISEAMEIVDVTFDKIKNRENPEIPSHINPANETVIDFIIGNISLVYDRTNNPGLAKYLYKKIDTLQLPETDKERLKNKLETIISG